VGVGNASNSKGRASARCADAGEDGEDTRPTGVGGNEGSATLVREGPTPVEATAVDALSCIDGSHVNEVEPRPEGAPHSEASTPSPHGALAPTHLGRCPWWCDINPCVLRHHRLRGQ
jgi:hypothetical protein